MTTRSAGLLPVLALALLSVETTASAQLSFQVPVVETFGGRFSTVVPDRGTVYLGGVSRAGRSYSRGGCGCFSRPGVGSFVESSSLSASVWIHDLREMDQLVLDAAESPAAAERLRLSGLVEDSQTSARFRSPAFRDDVFSRRERQSLLTASAADTTSTDRLLRDSSSFRTSSAAGTTLDSDDELPRIIVVNRSAATQWYRLGKTAEDSGKPDVAKLHYRQAARYGSTLARNRLKELSR